MAKKMYVVQSDDEMFYCGMRHWDKQLRKARIYHSWDYADDIASDYKERNCKIIEVSLAIEQKTKTNADRIRAMSDEELAKEFADCAIGLYCDTRKKGIPELPESVKREVFDSLLEWLKQPAEDGGDHDDD